MLHFCPELAPFLESRYLTADLMEENPVTGPAWPAALVVAGHLPVVLERRGCKIARRDLNRLEHSVRRPFEASEVRVWTKCHVPDPRWSDAPSVDELLELPDVRYFAADDEPVELSHVIFAVESADVQFTLEFTDSAVTGRAHGDDDRINHLVAELEKLLDKTQSRLVFKSVPSRAVGAVGGAVVGLLGALVTGWGITDRSLSSVMLMLCILVMCAVGGWLVIDRLKQRTAVRLYASESVPKGWWRQWEVTTKIMLVSLVITAVGTVATGLNVYLTHTADKPSSPAGSQDARP
ncbi:hypothetical protein A8W25_31615 [Streptomyces sp. ERV7]|nr:hypothetical protein A8W25_31615 [Streptomyces sp. ERV7]